MKKNIVKVLMFMLVALLIYSNFAIANTGTIITTTVRLREEPDSSSTTLMLVGEDEEVEILGEEENWYEVSCDGVTGYIAKEYVLVDGDTDEIEDEDIIEELTEDEVTEENTETDDIFNTITLSEDVNIRYMPSFSSNISNTIGSGSEVTVLMTLNKWVKITDGNVTGWAVRQNI